MNNVGTDKAVEDPVKIMMCNAWSDEWSNGRFETMHSEPTKMPDTIVTTTVIIEMTDMLLIIDSVRD